MDYGRDSSGDVVHIIPTNQGNRSENWGLGSTDQAVWATEEDYGVWNREASGDANSNFDGRQSQTRSGSEPPNKIARISQPDVQSTNRSKAIGKMFFKTKLCCKFRAGTCPYVTNCNFAHSIEELRRPPPNWQEIVAAHEEEQTANEPREEFQIPTLGSTAFPVEPQRSSKGRHCKKFFTEEGCPYGENCSFLHDDQSRTRESVAISLGPGSGGGYGGGANAGSGGGSGGGVSPSTLKPSNWKTRICNKWEQTGFCPFGNKCHFAHGAAELHRYGGGLVEGDGKEFSSPSDMKQGTVPSKSLGDTLVASVPSVPYADGYHMGTSQRVPNMQRAGQGLHQKWKGPDKISLIYGDWIEDLE